MQRIPTENQRERELVTTLKLLSPGTSLREGIDHIIQAQTGGLIIIGDTPEILNLTEGGFRINCPYTPMRLAELAKMDGAIILSSDMKRIVRANVTLQVNPSISSNETGLRHRAAEKFAKETNHIVLAVSRRRNTLMIPSELTTEIERALLIIKDYYREEERDEYQAYEHILGLDANDLAAENNICSALGYSHDVNKYGESLEPRGYRMLSQIPRIPMNIVENIVQNFNTLEAIITASVDTLQSVDGVGKTRASAIKDALVQMKTGASQPPILALSIFEWD